PSSAFLAEGRQTPKIQEIPGAPMSPKARIGARVLKGRAKGVKHIGHFPLNSWPDIASLAPGAGGKTMPKAPILRVGLVWMLLLGIFYGLSRVTTSLFGADYTVARHVFSAVL